ncbi:hypothetical protein AB0N88_13175 [Streptomyces sp. NPDC093516]
MSPSQLAEAVTCTTSTARRADRPSFGFEVVVFTRTTVPGGGPEGVLRRE